MSEENLNLTKAQVNSISQLVQQRIHDHEIQQWYSEIHDDNKKQVNQQNKLRTFRKFKTIYQREDYLKEVKNIRHRVTLTKLRISDHRLKVETGRYTRPYTELERRVCEQCNDGIEDEAHFLLSCPKYNEERQTIFDLVKSRSKTNLLELNNEERLKFFLDPKILTKQIAKYCNKISQIRKST